MTALWWSKINSSSICVVLEPMTTEINQFSQILLADPGPSYFIGAKLKSSLKNLLKSLPLVLIKLAQTTLTMIWKRERKSKKRSSFG